MDGQRLLQSHVGWGDSIHPTDAVLHSLNLLILIYIYVQQLRPGLDDVGASVSVR